MHAGRVVTTGTVAELVDSTDTTVVTLAPGSDPDVLADALRGLEGVTEVESVPDVDEPHVVVVADLARAEVVRAAAGSGADVVGVSSRRQLEEVFLGVIAAASGSDPDLRQVRSR
jgi:ABC-2 type transport system ATP-binding protein